MQSSSRRLSPEVQSALAAKQQAQQAQDIARLQEQLDASQKALDQQKAAAQKLEQVKKRHSCSCADAASVGVTYMHLPLHRLNRPP